MRTAPINDYLFLLAVTVVAFMLITGVWYLISPETIRKAFSGEERLKQIEAREWFNSLNMTSSNIDMAIKLCGCELIPLSEEIRVPSTVQGYQKLQDEFEGSGICGFADVREEVQSYRAQAGYVSVTRSRTLVFGVPVACQDI